MAQKKKSSKASASNELDSVYLLKLVLYVIIGAQWLRITTHSGSQVPIPVGLFIGAVFAMHEHFRVDRKIEYAVLLIAMLVGFWSQAGIFVTL